MVVVAIVARRFEGKDLHVGTGYSPGEFWTEPEPKRKHPLDC